MNTPTEQSEDSYQSALPFDWSETLTDDELHVEITSY